MAFPGLIVIAHTLKLWAPIYCNNILNTTMRSPPTQLHLLLLTALLLLLILPARSFQPTQSTTTPSLLFSSKLKSTVSSNGNEIEAPPLQRNPPRKVYLMVEPTPFTHVSGYANRFKEMLRFLNKAGDKVDILTVDSKTPAEDLPKSIFGFPIRHTLGFTFPLYNQISLTLDLPEMKGAQRMEKFKPDLIHVTSP